MNMTLMLRLGDFIVALQQVFDHADALGAPDTPPLPVLRKELHEMYLPIWREHADKPDATVADVQAWLAEHVDELDALGEPPDQEVSPAP
jgi:hypothetical protein